ncbi:MAG: hypothetical protein BWY83_02930 [bacterium ADurb.Bin478]|nr:MAG: hypothetical protein BWY83_02930 [bacterium ADurb.Bin478]
MHHDQRDGAVAQADPLQHAGPALGREIQIQKAIDQKTEKDQFDGSHQNVAVNRFHRGVLHAFGQGKGYAGADNEEKQGKDQIVKGKAVPLRVAELLRHFERPGCSHKFEQRAAKGRAAHDPEHVKAAQGVDGVYAFIFC